MIKYLVVLILGLLVFKNAGAQKRDTLMFFVKNPGKVVSTKDSADYVMFIMPNDTTDKLSLYPVLQFYLNGKRRLIAMSHTRSLPLVMEGPCINYFNNGNRRSITNFRNGKVTGDLTEYYPNGKLYAIKKYVPRKGYLLIECRDSTGNTVSENGNGKLLEYDDNFTVLLKEETVKDGAIQKVLIKDTNQFIEDTLKDAAYDKTGKVFVRADVLAQFSGGINAFISFIHGAIRYPKAEKDDGIQDTVFINFIVEKDGALSHLKAIRGHSQGLINACLKAVSLSPKWTPGFLNGATIRLLYTLPVNFTLSENKPPRL